ncbi:hypothetical protein MRX96_057774 [Rhipicephalus microplus]
MEVRLCLRCSFFSTQFIKVINHIDMVHSVESIFSVFCGIDGCSSTYRKFASYRPHFYRQNWTLLEDTGRSLKHRSHGGTNNADRPDGMGNECFQQQEAGPEPMKSDSFGTRNEEPVTDSANLGTSKGKVNFQCFLEEAKSVLVFQLVMKAYANQISHDLKTFGAARELDLLLSCSFIPDLFKRLDKNVCEKTEKFKYCLLDLNSDQFIIPKCEVL